MKSFMRKRESLVSDILENYHYSFWVKLTHKRIDEIPETLERIYYRFGKLVAFPPSSHEEGKQQIAELKKIRRRLKKFYDKEVFRYV